MHFFYAKQIKPNLIYLLLLFLSVLGGGTFAQNNILLYNEDFETGGNSFILNQPGVGSNSGNNTWIINDEYLGNVNYPNTTDQTLTTAGNITLPNNNYLHIHDAPSAGTVSNANYSRAGASDRFAIFDPGICTQGLQNIRITFYWMGQGSSSDYVEMYYSGDGGPWTQVGPNTLNNQTLWTQVNVTDPGFANRGNLRFGFRWVNSTGTPPNTISFGMDDVFVLGDYNGTVNPVDITVTSVPDSACQGDNIILSFALSDTLCSGQYLLRMEDQQGNLATNQWVFNINYPQTTAAVLINIPTTVPTDTCYVFRLNRVSPLPQITGTVSVCFNLVACPNTITPEQPAVTIGSEMPGGQDVCVGSVIDVPFWSTGTYQAGNIYTAELSDDLGSFANPLVIGTSPDASTYDPAIVPNPGMVSGIIPNTIDGCGYFIRVISSNPATVGTVWGPFCIENCDMETNNRMDLQFCIGQTFGDSTRMPYDINTNASNTYALGNEFQLEILDMMTFASLNTGDLGSIMSTISDTMDVNVPPEPILAGAPYNLAPGNYYARVVATSSNDPDLALGTVIRCAIGAPDENGPNLFASPDTFCNNLNPTVIFRVLGGDPNSTYTMTILQNGQQFDYIAPAQILGLIFNGWPPGFVTYRVQELNYGCLGPPVEDTLVIQTAPTGAVVGPRNVCWGDTSVFTSAPFIPNTAYGWSLNPSNAGTILSQGSNQVQIVWDSIPSGNVTVTLDFATNVCGASSGQFNLTIRELPTIDAGPDTSFCPGNDVPLGGSPTSSGGQSPYDYAWSPPGGLNSVTTANPTASPSTGPQSYYLTVTDAWGCQAVDTVVVDLAAPPALDIGPPDTLLCDGGTLTLDATHPDAVLYLWSTGETTPTIDIDSSGTYYVDIFDVLNCQGSDTINVSLREPLAIDLGIDSSVCVFDKPAYVIGVDAPDADILWSDGSVTDSIEVQATGDYWVMVENECETVSDSVFLIIIDEEEKYFLPNVFTPNGDGNNDFFMTETGIPLDDFKMVIFDRWGRRVYETVDPFFMWGGNDEGGNPLQEGVFFLVISGYNCAGEYFEEKGNVTLLR